MKSIWADLSQADSARDQRELSVTRASGDQPDRVDSLTVMHDPVLHEMDISEIEWGRSFARGLLR